MWSELVALGQIIVIDLVLAGGLLLLWVCWKFVRGTIEILTAAGS